MKKTLTTIMLVCCLATGFSQTIEAEKDLKTQASDTIDGWKGGGTIAINLTQVSLTNWAAGGQNSVSANGLLSLFAHYKKDKSM